MFISEQTIIELKQYLGNLKSRREIIQARIEAIEGLFQSYGIDQEHHDVGQAAIVLGHRGGLKGGIALGQ